MLVASCHDGYQQSMIEHEEQEAPSGMHDDAEEAPPMGVPADADDDDDGDPELPGIPTEDSPPSTG
jgi:hypothetical protein